ncbi:hypothetical protein [Nostoc sp. S13]|uniref:hypothetical protein n=1 Tax=Nostoc sp. S13 TaxID=3019266 RepID=UPI002612D5B8|nr:hypothetical protein [Nostoc sp. S13]MDF5739695.1 hypothetical protein [Nostoc sp. S13]
MKSPEILSVSLASLRYTSEEIGATYVLNLSVWGVGGVGSGGTGENNQCPMTNDQ